MFHLSVPTDFTTDLVDAFVRLNQTYREGRIAETYGNVTKGLNFVASGRATENLPEVDLDALAIYIEYSRRHGIDFLYTLNAVHFQNAESTPDGVRALKELIHSLYDAGVRTLIVAMPSLMEIIKSTRLGFRIKASVFCGATTANRALALRKMGVDKLVVDEAVVRDFGVLKRIRRAFGEQVELIVNPYCHKECLYRRFHHSQLAFDCGRNANEVSNTYYTNRCIARHFDDVSNVFKLMWIRPEDLHYYTDIGINLFKLQGRQTLGRKSPDGTVARGDIPRTAECYLQQRHDGDLNDLISTFSPGYRRFRVPIDNRKLDGFLEPFVENEGFCKSDCASCGYCASYAKRVIDMPRFEKNREVVQRFFSTADSFRQIIWAEGQPPGHFPS